MGEKVLVLDEAVHRLNEGMWKVTSGHLWLQYDRYADLRVERAFVRDGQLVIVCNHEDFEVAVDEITAVVDDPWSLKLRREHNVRKSVSRSVAECGYQDVTEVGTALAFKNYELKHQLASRLA